MDIMTLEERINKRAQAKMNRAIDKFKRDIEKCLKELMLDMNFSNGNTSIPVEGDRNRWGSTQVFEGTMIAFKLLQSALMTRFIYPTDLLARYEEKERQEILQICDEVSKLTAIYENREDIQAGEDSEQF